MKCEKCGNQDDTVESEGMCWDCLKQEHESTKALWEYINLLRDGYEPKEIRIDLRKILGKKEKEDER